MNDSQTKNNTSDRKSMKVTDRRMFTSEGELREQYRHLETAVGEAGAASSGPPPPKAEIEPPPKRKVEGPPPEPEPESDEPNFVDLVSLLAENASVYLRQAGVPGGDSAQSLEVARLHIDLLGVLQNKTQGNLNPQEQAMLDDVIYRLRLAYSSQRGF